MGVRKPRAYTGTFFDGGDLESATGIDLVPV